ncbi:unnamed protein product, partial [Ascophyllum nodosum]
LCFCTGRISSTAIESPPMFSSMEWAELRLRISEHQDGCGTRLRRGWSLTRQMLVLI